LHYNILPALSI
jgi:serine/threonine protein kinase